MSEALSRAVRKQTIVGAFQRAAHEGRAAKLTMYQVAKALNLAPSTKLQQIMLEMEQEGTLQFVIKYRKDNRWKRIFSLSSDHAAFHHGIARTIKINGQQVTL